MDERRGARGLRLDKAMKLTGHSAGRSRVLRPSGYEPDELPDWDSMAEDAVAIEAAFYPTILPQYPRAARARFAIPSNSARFLGRGGRI